MTPLSFSVSLALLRIDIEWERDMGGDLRRYAIHLDASTCRLFRRTARQTYNLY